MTIEAAVFAVTAAGSPSLPPLVFRSFWVVLQHVHLGPVGLYYVRWQQFFLHPMRGQCEALSPSVSGMLSCRQMLPMTGHVTCASFIDCPFIR